MSVATAVILARARRRRFQKISGVTGRPLLHKSLYLPELEIITLLVNPGVGDGRFKRKTAAFLRCLPWSIRPAAIVPRCHHARCTFQECPRIAPLTSLKAQKSLEIQDLWRADDRLRPRNSTIRLACLFPRRSDIAQNTRLMV